MKAWHFLADSGKLRDGKFPPPDGEWLIHDGSVKICASGLHASKNILDALEYAPGGILCRVECEDIVDRHGDKFVCRKRKILWRIDANKVLRKFARMCALDVIHLWDAPDVMVKYLKTGDESIREAAWFAAMEEAWEELWYVVMESASKEAWYAAMEAAKEPERELSWYASWDAAREASWYAAKKHQDILGTCDMSGRLYRLVMKERNKQ